MWLIKSSERFPDEQSKGYWVVSANDQKLDNRIQMTKYLITSHEIHFIINCINTSLSKFANKLFSLNYLGLVCK